MLPSTSAINVDHTPQHVEQFLATNAPVVAGSSTTLNGMENSTEVVTELLTGDHLATTVTQEYEQHRLHMLHELLTVASRRLICFHEVFGDGEYNIGNLRVTISVLDIDEGGQILLVDYLSMEQHDFYIGRMYIGLDGAQVFIDKKEVRPDSDIKIDNLYNILRFVNIMTGYREFKQQQGSKSWLRSICTLL